MDPQLLKAVSTGDADLLAQILSTSTDHACLEGVTGEGNSALHIAARHGYLKLVEKICERDVSLIKARNNLLDTPLICAARAGHVDVVDHLIQHASETVLRAWNSSGATAVHEAVRNGHESVLEKLLLREARLAAVVDGQGVSPLYMAVVSNQADMVDILISESREEGTVRSPASYAGPDGLTALHAAVFARNAQEMCESLQRWEPTLVQKVDSSGRTALHYAASAGKTGVVKVLLDNNLLCYIPDDDGLYPVHYAAIAGKDKVIREIMEICPSCDELVDKKHRNFLHCAVESGRSKVLWYVCRNSNKFTSIMNAGDSEGNTPLHLAVKHGNSFVFFLLMMKPTVNLDIINHKGLTPLGTLYEDTHIYSFSAFMNVCMLLCKAGSSPSNLAISLRSDNCLEDDKQYSDMRESLLPFVGAIMSSFAAVAFTLPGSNACMELSDGSNIEHIATISNSFYYSTIVAWLLSPSLATTRRRRYYYLQLSSLMVLLAVDSMLAAFMSVVQRALDPQKSLLFLRTEYYLTKFCLSCLLVVPFCLRILRTRKLRPRQDLLKVLATIAINLWTIVLSLTRYLPLKESCLVNKSMTYSWPGCHDANCLHPT